MVVVDEVSMQQMFPCYHRNRFHVSSIELYVEFEQLAADVVDDVSYVNVERHTLLEELYSVSEDDFEANYEAPEKEEECNKGVDVVVQNASNPVARQHPFGVPSYMRQLNLEALDAHEFSEYANIAIAALDDSEFIIRLEWNTLVERQ
ncbi:hypothetical protein PIB30_043070 [Stylosanthes scabra]|uniref:Uncharacterized protein n=1 Tax=Stylosanthes scabra TaxID=79078 RepID=A0ABU6RG31_9FABA|nr:hypothetical protein [Stylosanthes scabra]